MNCPVCDEALLVRQRQGIEIDTCPRCRGVWLDRGELDRLIDRSAAWRDDEDGDHPRGYERHERDDDERHGRRGEPYRKKESFLGRLFDLD